MKSAALIGLENSGDGIITCFQTRLQLVKELGGDDLKHNVEEVEVRQPGDQHQRLGDRVT